MTTASLNKLKSWLADPGTINLGGVPDGYEAVVLAEALSELCGREDNPTLVFIARDGQRAADVETAFEFFAPWADVLHVPAWDCLPYDRVSPSNEALAKRISALAQLAGRADSKTSFDHADAERCDAKIAVACLHGQACARHPPGATDQHR